jgi:hypothetical protein
MVLSIIHGWFRAFSLQPDDDERRLLQIYGRRVTMFADVCYIKDLLSLEPPDETYTAAIDHVCIFTPSPTLGECPEYIRCAPLASFFFS